eukprot:680069-Prymnesium_polylepis.1
MVLVPQQIGELGGAQTCLYGVFDVLEVPWALVRARRARDRRVGGRVVHALVEQKPHRCVVRRRQLEMDDGASTGLDG